MVGGVLVVVWIASLVALAQRHEGPDRASGQAVVSDGAPGMHEGDEWQTVYLKAERIGYLHLAKRRLGGDSGGWKIAYEMELDLQVMKTSQKVRTTLEAVLDDELTVVEFDFALDGGVGGQMSARGTVKGRTVDVELKTGGHVTAKTFDLPIEPRLAVTNKALLAHQGLEVGKSFEISFFDPSTMGQRTVVIEVIAKEKVHVMGKSHDAFVLEQDIDGMVLRAWVTPAGDVLQEELPLGLLAVRETEEEARYGMGEKLLMPGSVGQRIPKDDAPGQDLLELTAPRLIGELPSDASELRRLVVEFEPSLQGSFKLEGGRQSMDGERLTIVRDELPVGASIPDPASSELSEAGREALQSELLVQSDHPAIIARAREIVGNVKDGLVIARRLADWVHRKLVKVNVVGIPSALETLTALRGDCNEHTTLFAALARASGIPTRINVGMARVEDRFYYHAWPEVLLEGSWLNIDPTWGQFPADVTHIRFVQGGLQKQLEMFKVIGTLRAVRVVEQTR